MSNCNCNTAPWKKKCCPDCIVTVNECCLCEIDGCIVQDCDAGQEQYVFSDTNVDICINIKNDAVREFIASDGSTVICASSGGVCAGDPEFCNCDFTATLLNTAGGTVLGPITIKPGQKKSLIAKQVSQLIITGVPGTGCNVFNGVRGSYNGTVRLVV